MRSRKHIIVTKLFEFGGSNTHLKTLIKYFGAENIILVIEDEGQLKWLENIGNPDGLHIEVRSSLHKFAHLVYPSVLSNMKEACFVIKSIFAILLLSIRHGGADITICSVEAEKYLYLLWAPFIRVIYILHSTPPEKFTRFTSYTCNTRLGRRKQIITVSNANKKEICTSWEINPEKQQFVQVVYNCLLKDAADKPTKVAGHGIKNIVTMGHVIAYKNPHVWLEVARQITQAQPEVRFTWLGNGSLFDHFSNATEDTDRINFAGFTANTDEYLVSATLYYQPSIHETHGISVVEAMYHSLPCVVANAGGLPESVQENYNGLLADPHNIEANVDAIVSLINDEERLKTFGENGYKRYLDLFTFEKFKLKMDAIYYN